MLITAREKEQICGKKVNKIKNDNSVSIWNEKFNQKCFDSDFVLIEFRYSFHFQRNRIIANLKYPKKFFLTETQCSFFSFLLNFWMGSFQE